MSLKTNFFQAPYFDDYYEEGGARENNYVRILYRPAFAVQARELTQTQTMLQDQVRRFGDHVFKNGSLVTGGGFELNDEYRYVKITQDQSVVEDRIGEKLEGQASGVQGNILDVQHDGTNTILYIEYTKNGDNDKVFRDGEDLLFVNLAVDPLTAIGTNATGETIIFSIEEGVLYVNGFFIQFETQSILVSLDDNTVDADVGFVVDENIVTPEEDDQLLDNATGSPTFSAPGAHRYQVLLGLAVLDPSETENNKNYFNLVEIRDGQEYHKRDVPEYSEIRKQQDRRTFDLQGHAAIEPFGVQIKEHLKTADNNGVFTQADGGDHEKLIAKISPGRAYVRGRNIRFLQSQLVEFDKGIQTDRENDVTFTASLGNYFNINEVAGTWCQTCVPVSLRDTALTAVSSASEPDNIDVDANSNEIGTALFYIAQHSSGTPGQAAAEYRAYLFNIQMTSGKIEDVRSIVAGYGSGDRSIGDIVLEDVSGFTNPQAKLQETSLRSLVYELPEDYVKTLRDADMNVTTTFMYADRFDVNVSAGEFTITPNTSDEVFPYGDTISQTEANEIIVTDDLGNIMEIDAAATTVSATSMTIQLVTSYDGAATVTVPVQKQNVREARKNILRDRLVKIDYDTQTSTTEFNLGFSDIFQVTKITRGGTYSLSNEDITNWFEVRDGQRDAYYDHGKIRLKEGKSLAAGDKLVVQLDYFEHDFSQGVGYFSIDSYPIDDVNIDEPTAIQTWEVPNYESRRQGTYALAESVDFRNRIEDTATDTTTLSSASINPATNDTFLIPASGLINIAPASSFSTDLEYYLGYYMLIAINKDREIVTRSSSADKNPQVPEKLDEEMDIAVIEITPYPSLSPKFANQLNKQEFAVSKRTLSNRAYQHKDVEKLDQRIQRLENQVSLSQLEEDAKDKSIINDEGLNQFKTGFVTDSFQGHDLGQFNEPGYDCAIASSRARLSPAFDLNQIHMRLDVTTNTNRD